MNLRRLILVLFALVCLSAPPARAEEEVIEAWRSPFGVARAVSVDPTDGSCWVADRRRGEVIHLAEDGVELWRGGEFTEPWSVSVNRADGSCWVADRGTYDFEFYRYFDSAVVHLGADGSELWRGEDFNGPWSVSVNPADGSCWVADSANGEVVHLGADGTELWRDRLAPPDDYSIPTCVSVNPSDGSCWAGDAETGALFHLAEDGSTLWAAGGFSSLWSVSLNPADGSCWLADHYYVVHLDQDGVELWEGRFRSPVSVSVNPADGSCWVAESGGSGVGPGLVHVAEDGTRLLRCSGFDHPGCVSVNSRDGSCWLSDAGYTSALVHVEAGGDELWRGSFKYVRSLGVNSSDGSCWVALWGEMTGGVAHLAPDGARLPGWSADLYQHVVAVSVNLTDGSCWVSAYEPDEVIHLAAEGRELWRARRSAGSISVNPRDGSLWFGDTVTGDLVRMAEDGTTSWRGAGLAGSLSVNARDGSCWVARYSAGEVIHVAEDGAELWRGTGFDGPQSPSVNSADGSCWLIESGADQVIHLAEDGTLLWRGGAFSGPTFVSVNPTDGSCWVADSGNGQVVRLLPVAGYPRFLDVPFHYWAYEQVEACAEAGIVSGYPDGLYHPDYNVTRDQMAVFISRALVGGDENVPPGPRSPSFLDVPRWHWAYKYIEYAKARGIVEGYSDAFFLPDLTVNRAQMAVFIARAIADPTGEEGLAGYQPPDSPTFTDIPTDYWCYKHIEYLAENQVVSGYPDGAYQPTSTVTRDQMAVFIARAFDLPM